MSKIQSLTKEQESQIPKYLEKFLEIGLSTRVTNRTKAEEALFESYQYMNKISSNFSKKVEFIWAESPMEGAKLAAQHAKGDTEVTVAEVKEQSTQASYGSFEAYWVSTYAFITEQLPVAKDGLIDIVLGIINECGAYWTFEDLVIISPKPTEIHMVDKVLHSTTGKALLYPDGNGLYSFRGEIKNSLMEVSIADRVSK